MSRLDARSWSITVGKHDPERREAAWAPGIERRRVWSGDYEGTTIIGVRERGEGLSGARWYARPDGGPRRGPYTTRSEAALTVDVSRPRAP